MKNEVTESLAAALVHFEMRCKEIVSSLPDVELSSLAEHFQGYAEPITNFLRRETRFRAMVAEAKEYMERTGAAYYCFQCRGTCTPEHWNDD